MGLKRIDERLSRVATIVKGWNGNSSVPRIERDLALEELRHIYDEILDYTPEEREECAEEKTESVEREERAVVTVAPIAESIADVVDDFDDALDIDALLGIGAEEESATSQEQSIAEAVETTAEEVVEESMVEVAQEIVVESEPEIVAEPEPKSESVEEPVAEPEVEVSADAEAEAEDGTSSGALFNLDDIPVRAKRGRKMVQLYSDNFTSRVVTAQEDESAESEAEAEEIAEPVQPAVERVVVEEQSAEEPKCLADVLGGGVKTLADAMASSDEPTTPLNRVTELRKAIGLNDKFLLVRDLFGGDVERYEATIDTLDEFEDLDECMIYIVENFRWNPDSEAARLIVSLLERKLA
ncbi:MAG: hypothetical protein IKU96_05585 [Alistipes sp.]|nr:hypothetical protein [Alistipes sp.]